MRNRPAWAQQRRPPPYAYPGTVTDETGGVMQAVTVRLYQSDGTDPIRATTTDGDGSFAVEVPAGEYRVTRGT